MAVVRAVAVFCGARSGADPKFARIAAAAGRAIAARGWQLVYGGGRLGLMGVLAQAALDHGGEVIGVIPEALLVREQAHRGLTRLETVADMSVRKQRMVALADAFLTLPGGFGTLDELFEVLTLHQTRYHDKPVALLNAQGYFDGLLAMCEGFVRAGFVSRGDADLLCCDTELEPLLDRLGSGLA